MTLYLVYRRGMYMQGIGGVFSTRDAALAVIDRLRQEESDCYHSFHLAEVPLNALVRVGEPAWNSQVKFARRRAKEAIGHEPPLTKSEHVLWRMKQHDSDDSRAAIARLKRCFKPSWSCVQDVRDLFIKWEEMENLLSPEEPSHNG